MVGSTTRRRPERGGCGHPCGAILRRVNPRPGPPMANDVDTFAANRGVGRGPRATEFYEQRLRRRGTGAESRLALGRSSGRSVAERSAVIAGRGRRRPTRTRDGSTPIARCTGRRITRSHVGGGARTVGVERTCGTGFARAAGETATCRTRSPATEQRDAAGIATDSSGAGAGRGFARGRPPQRVARGLSTVGCGAPR